jgi:hypothetical protein
MLQPEAIGRLFDDQTRRAIASGLCVECRSAKLLCRKARCPLLVQYGFMMRTRPLVHSLELDGASPPSVFVGRQGYPKVFVGPMTPPVHGDTSILDAPERWVDLTIDDIIDFRSQLVRGMYRTDVHDVETGGRIVDATRELALAEVPSDVEAEFVKRPSGRLRLDGDAQPFGPSAPLKRVDLGNVKVERHLDKATSDTDWLARGAVLWLHEEGVPVTQIQKAFSVGSFGLGDNRRLVPTRWSITAVDDTVGISLRERVKEFPLINEWRVHMSVGFDDRFVVIQAPQAWKYELVEAWYPGTLWNPLGKRTVLYDSHEFYRGRTTYADIGGCYYAARLAVGEKLLRDRRQAATVILRETHPGYIVPVGVWNVRENVRRALRREPRKFDTLREALYYASTRLAIPMERWIRRSVILQDMLHQRRIEDFG